MANEKWMAVAQWAILTLLVGGVVAYCFFVPNSANTYWTRMAVTVAALIVLYFAFYFFLRYRINQRIRRYYLVAAVRGERPAAGAVDLGDTSAFWSSSDSPAGSDDICSICLANADAKQETAKTNCCGSYLHKNCAESYWHSVNDILCPNCRFSMPHVATVTGTVVGSAV